MGQTRVASAARVVQVEFADRRGEIRLVEATIPDVPNPDQTVAYSFDGTVVRWQHGRLYQVWRPRPGSRFVVQGDPRSADDAFLSAVLAEAAGDLHGMNDLVTATQLQLAADRYAMVAGDLWKECGEPVYTVRTMENDGHLAKLGLPKMVHASVGVVHSPGIPVVGDDDFAADRYDAAVLTLHEWADRGYEPNIEGRGFKRLETLPRISVTGLHTPGSTWTAQGLLALPDPGGLDRAEFAEALNTLNLRLRLVHAMPDPRGAFNDLVESRLTSLQMAVVHSFRARAAELGMAIGSSTWTPPAREYRHARRR